MFGERSKGCGHRGGRHGHGGRDKWLKFAAMAQRSAGAFGDDWGGKGDHGPRGGRGRRRIFGGDELRLLLLKLIAERPRHGYDLIREVEERSGGAYAPSPGVVYPTLTLLAEMDLIAAQASEASKKSFELTPAGEVELTERAQEVAALLARLEAMSEHRARSHGGPVRRAMGNLRQVLVTRMETGALDPDMLHAITDIIDDAARKIERL